ncbi:hypothetical protein [Stenotrophomonas maltophilia]|uniref:hypothetical protein n=1 Tax=Stenotrophomonas maltophilia TaxID=40324 RepID=UPI0025F82BCF|nr:hypothetical protein [uncultured Stenotrophomonas sp.]
MKGIVAAVAIATVLAGCSATRPIATEMAKPVPASQIFAYAQPAADTGAVVVTRDVGLSGSKCPVAFYVDGKVAANVDNGQTMTLHVPSGKHILGAGPAGTGVCGIVSRTAHLREAGFDVVAGSTMKLRLGFTRDGTYQITQTAL